MQRINIDFSILSRLSAGIALALSLSSCANQFEYKPNDWHLVTHTRGDNVQTAYIDKNRTIFEDGIHKTWVKLEFNSDQEIPYAGDKRSQVSGVMIARRIDSSVWYDCRSKTASIISYQIYSRNGDLLDAKWQSLM